MARRNKIACGLALVAGFVLTQSGTAGADTLQNTGFETYTNTTGIADQWVGYQPSTASGGYQVVGSPVYEGMQAQRFAFGNMGMLEKSHIEQLFNIEPGAEYEVSGYFNIESLNRSYMQLMIEYFDAEGNLVDSNVTNQVQRTNGYIRFQNIKVANTQAVYCRVSVGLLATADGASGAFTVDQIALHKAGDVLVNAGFEDYHGMYDVADSWRFGYSPGSTHSQKVVTSPVASGTLAQKVSASGLPYWGYAHVMQVVTAHPGESYTVTGKFNVAELNGSKVQLYIDYYDANYKHLGSDYIDKRSVTDGYVQVTNKTRAPKNCAFFQVWALLRSTVNNGSGTFYVDDLSVTSDTYIPPEQPVVDLTQTISDTSTAKLGSNNRQIGNSANSNLVSTDGTWTSVYDFETPSVVREYAIAPSLGVDLSREAKNWTFEGFDGQSWSVLDTQSEVTDWTADTAKTFTLDNKQAYWQYRLNVTANNGDTRYLDLDGVSLNGYFDRPNTPLDVWNSDKGDGTVTLSWSPSNGVTSYRVYQDEQLVQTLPGDASTVTLTGLTNDRVYHYNVSAVNGAGESLKSPEVDAMPYSSAQSLNPIVTNDWQGNALTATITYDFAKPTRVREYTMKPGLNSKQAPKNWTFEGFDGLQWVELDKQSDITQWPSKHRRYFTLDNSQSYLKYRLKLSTDYGMVAPLKKNDIQLIGN